VSIGRLAQWQELDDLARKRSPGVDGGVEHEPVEQARQEVVGVSVDRDVDPRMTLGQLGSVDVHLHDLAVGHELLPVEAGLLEAEPRPESDEDVGTLGDDVGGALAPRVRPAEVVGVGAVDPVDPVPCRHHRRRTRAKQRERGQHRFARDAAADQQQRSPCLLEQLTHAEDVLFAGARQGRRRRGGARFELVPVDWRALDVEAELEKHWAAARCTA
jgi:hypothetical protein